MALRVGMRVKKVRGRGNIGLTGTVVLLGFENNMRPEGTMKVKIDKDATGFVRHYHAGEVAVSDPSEWEPIIPEGHKPVEWSQCLWQPEHIREGVST